jgi:FMN phosphatase YigB (HAD superfamily)
VDGLFDPDLRILSYEQRARKPSERLFGRLLEVLRQRGLEPEQVLHIGSRMNADMVPAKRLGLRTGLFAGDKASLQATIEQLKDSLTRPDVLLTDLEQIADVVS